MDDSFTDTLGDRRGTGESVSLRDPGDRAIAALIESGSRWMRPSAVATRAAIGEPEALAALNRWVLGGGLAVAYQVLCPESGRTLASYDNREDIPETIACDQDECEDEGGEHDVDTRDIWVVYRPVAQSA